MLRNCLPETYIKLKSAYYENCCWALPRNACKSHVITRKIIHNKVLTLILICCGTFHISVSWWDQWTIGVSDSINSIYNCIFLTPSGFLLASFASCDYYLYIFFFFLFIADALTLESVTPELSFSEGKDNVLTLETCAYVQSVEAPFLVHSPKEAPCIMHNHRTDCHHNRHCQNCLPRAVVGGLPCADCHHHPGVLRRLSCKNNVKPFAALEKPPPGLALFFR